MAREISNTVRYFLRTQVLRADYVIVERLPALEARLPYEQKLERVHDLCIRNGYRTPEECESIRRRLYENHDDTDLPAALLLTASYLPNCLAVVDEQDELQRPRQIRVLERQARQLPGISRHYQSSTLEWDGQIYLMCLPLDIHFLLVEHDGALLVA